MHLCYLNKDFLGLGYDFYQPSMDNYGLITFKLFRCKKCGKLFYKNKTKLSQTFRNMFLEDIQRAISVGYRPIGELIKGTKL